jgi:tRNA threonylcarbamoyl adenosine modification protein (Sua5/YciO/YrdC/YwlC family)
MRFVSPFYGASPRLSSFLIFYEPVFSNPSRQSPAAANSAGGTDRRCGRDRHHLTLLCRDLSEIANYAKVDNRQYRLLKAATPGPYTFILEATREVPRRLSHPSRKTIGLRVPEHAIAHALLEELKQPLLGTTLILPGNDLPLNEAEDIREQLEKQIDLVIDGGSCSRLPTTVVDLTTGTPEIVREGKGDVSLFR